MQAREFDVRRDLVARQASLAGRTGPERDTERGRDSRERGLSLVGIGVEVDLEELVEKDHNAASVRPQEEGLDKGTRDGVFALQDIVTGRLSAGVFSSQGIDVEEDRIDETLCTST